MKWSEYHIPARQTARTKAKPVIGIAYEELDLDQRSLLAMAVRSGCDKQRLLFARWLYLVCKIKG